MSQFILHSQNLRPMLFSNLTALEELDLNNNELTTLSSDDLMGLDHINVLNLSHNGIASLTDVFKSVPSLETLDLSQNSLQVGRLSKIEACT